MNVLPACYSFFVKEFSKHAEAAQTNEEVSAVLSELCKALETLAANENDGGSVERRRPSIVDSPRPKNERSEDNNNVIEG